MTRRRIVVTGLGLVTPIGNTVTESWDNLIAGRSGIAPIKRFDPSNLAVQWGRSGLADEARRRGLI